jgi:hypothetical protein
LHISVAAYNMRCLKGTSNLSWKYMAGRFTLNKTVAFQNYSKKIGVFKRIISFEAWSGFI